MPPRICMRPLIIAVALTSKWFVRRRLLSRGVIASAHAHLASSSVASTRWQCRSVPMANFSLNILLDIVGGKAAVGEAAKAAAMAGGTSTSHEKPRHASAGPHSLGAAVLEKSASLENRLKPRFGDSIRKTAGGADPSFATRRIIFVADPSLFLCLPGWTPHVRKWRIVFADDPSRASLPYKFSR